MITSYQHFKTFVEKEGRIPEKEEFEEFGYTERTYYNCKKRFKEEVRPLLIKELAEKAKPLIIKELEEKLLKGGITNG